MADPEIETLVEQIKNGSAFESLRAATKLAEISRARKSAASSIPGQDDLRRVVRDAALRPDGLSELQQLIDDETSHSDSGTEGTVRPSAEGTVPKNR